MVAQNSMGQTAGMPSGGRYAQYNVVAALLAHLAFRRFRVSVTLTDLTREDSECCAMAFEATARDYVTAVWSSSPSTLYDNVFALYLVVEENEASDHGTSDYRDVPDLLTKVCPLDTVTTIGD